MQQDDDVEKGLPEAHAEEERTPKKLAAGDEAQEINRNYSKNDEENGENKTTKNIKSTNDEGVEGEDETASLFIQQRMHAISSVMGDVTPPYNRVKGYVGMVVWIFHFTAHFSFDFYEVKVSW